MLALFTHLHASEPCSPPQQPTYQDNDPRLYGPTTHSYAEYTDPGMPAPGAVDTHPNAPGPYVPPQQPIVQDVATESGPSVRDEEMRHGDKNLKNGRLRGKYLSKSKWLSNRRQVTAYPRRESIRRERVRGRLLRGRIPMNEDAGLRRCRLRFMKRRQYTRLLKGERLRRNSLEDQPLSIGIRAESQEGTQTMVPASTLPVAIIPTDGLVSEEIPRPVLAPEATQEANVAHAAATVGFNENTHTVYQSQRGTANTDLQAPDGQPTDQSAAYPPIPIPHTYDASVSSAPFDASVAPPPVPMPVASAAVPSTPVSVAPATASAAAAEDEDDDDNNLMKVIKNTRAKKALFTEGPMKWMPDKVVYGVREALKDLRAANRKSKKRIFSRKKPISLAGSIKVTKNFEGLMPGDKMARPQAKRNWINAYMQLVLDKRCGRLPADATLPPRLVKKANDEAADENKKGDSAGVDGDDGETKTVENGVDAYDDMIPAELAMGPDEVGGGVYDYTVYEFYKNSDAAATDDKQASPADVASMMSKMKIQHGASSSSSGQDLLAPVPQVADN